MSTGYAVVLSGSNSGIWIVEPERDQGSSRATIYGYYPSRRAARTIAERLNSDEDGDMWPRHDGYTVVQLTD